MNTQKRNQMIALAAAIILGNLCGIGYPADRKQTLCRS